MPYQPLVTHYCKKFHEAALPGFPLASNDLGHGDTSRYLRTAGLPCPILAPQRCGEQLCIPRSP